MRFLDIDAAKPGWPRRSESRRRISLGALETGRPRDETCGDRDRGRPASFDLHQRRPGRAAALLLALGAAQLRIGREDGAEI